MVPVMTAPKPEETLQCIFCEREVKEVTLEKENGKVEKYTKAQAKKDYVEFLNQLRHRAEVAKVLTKGDEKDPKIR
jgi:histone acetyltransferase (RNA polymerase elongator complex component)